MLHPDERLAEREPSDDVLAGLLESLSRDGLESVLAEVAALATEAIPDADGASVASLRDGQVTTFAATGESVRATVESGDLDQLLEKLRQQRARLISVTPLHGTLEDYFLAQTREKETVTQ